LVGERFALLNIADTARPYLRNGKTINFSILSRSGVASRHLTASLGEDVLTSYLQGFPVKISPPLDPELESKDGAPDCGRKLSGSFAQYNRNSSSWRTLQGSLIADLDAFSEIWPRSGMTRNGFAYPRPIAERRTNETGSGFWPTPNSRDWKDCGVSQGRRKSPNVGTVAAPRCNRSTYIPTPTASDTGMRTEKYNQGGRALSFWVWSQTRGNRPTYIPTPTAGDGKSSGSRNTPTSKANAGTSLTDWTRQDGGNGRQRSMAGRLNPCLSCWLMGWPIGWTALEPLATDKFQLWRQQHSNSSAQGSIADNPNSRTNTTNQPDDWNG
jgi:hypothetical protein